jgi:peptide/nickel transport system permease protein
VGRAVIRRLAHVVPVLLLVSLGTLLLLDLIPGDPAYAILGEGATPEQVDRVHEQLGLDDPLPERYVRWLGDLVQGDFGTSPRSHVPVWESITERLPVTLELAGLALLFALVLAVPTALYAAYRQGRLFDRVTGAMSSGLISSPAFLTGLLLVYFLALELRWYPVTDWVPLTEDPADNLRHAFLPALTLALAEAPVFMRLLRSDLIATLQDDFILSARAKGMSTPYVLVRHALRPSSFSLVTVLGISLGRLVGGTVIVESLFALPGLGQLMISSILNKDFVVVQGVVMFVALAYVFVNLAVDVVYSYLDPRVRVRAA